MKRPTFKNGEKVNFVTYTGFRTGYISKSCVTTIGMSTERNVVLYDIQEITDKGIGKHWTDVPEKDIYTLLKKE